MTDDRVGEEIIRRHSKSFALASRLLPPGVRTHAVAVYAWCRRADDAIDSAEPTAQRDALERLRRELEDVYGGVETPDPVLSIFQRSVRERRLPRRYAEDLLTGMELDVLGRRYETLDDLLEYCYYVAGCVGLMMCHVMGVKDDAALPRAAHLGIAMQLTNICRDVAEDWDLGRLYLPNRLTAATGAPDLVDRLGGAFPREASTSVARATERLLDEADRFYRSGDAGLPALSWRCSVSIRTARAVYSSIGLRIRARRCDPLAGRAYVPSGRKTLLALGSMLRSVAELPGRLAAGGGPPARIPRRLVDFPADILPLDLPRSVGAEAGS